MSDEQVVTAEEVGSTTVANLECLKGAAGTPADIGVEEHLAAVVSHLEKNPQEIGVLVRDGNNVQVLSRDWIAELLAKPYCRELFLHRPLTHMLRLYGVVPVELPDSTPIPQAIEKALSRESSARYQPLIVRSVDGSYWLLDIYSLLLKQCRVLASTLSDLEQQRRATQLAQAEREKLQQRLVDASREAGRAEVAIGVLHNVGNVLNSINVAAAVISKTVQQSKLGNLSKSVAMLEAHRNDLAAFLTSDERGIRLAGYLVKIAAVLEQEQARIREESTALNERLEHVRRVVAMQQSYAKTATMLERVRPADVFDDAIRVNLVSFERHNVVLERNYAALDAMPIDKHKVLQILINLVSNAKNAVKGQAPGQKRIVCSIETAVCNGNSLLRFRVADNGVGIPAENLTRIFTQGFTTRQDGHGFGLHSAVNAAREMGGSLAAVSEGPGHGAVFTLEVPIGQQQTPEDEHPSITSPSGHGKAAA